jgi:hypothetical protein
VNFNFAVSNSFTLSQASTVTGVNFGMWTSPGDTLSAIDWAITTTPDSYPINGTAAVTDGAVVGTGFGYYDLRWDSFSTGNVNLGPGTYYLVLQNAVTAGGNPAFWDINNGPSVAYENSIGPVQDNLFPGSNASSFQIIGTSGAPEPAEWALMLGGFGLAGAALRRRRSVAAAA